MDFRYTFTLLLFVSASHQLRDDELLCMDFKDKNTWPDQLLADLTTCQEETEDDTDVPQPTSTQRRGDITSKFRGFLQKVWSRYINTLKWSDNKINILNCMWNKQKLFNVESKLVQWNEVTAIIDGLKISDARKTLLRDGLNQCIKDTELDKSPSKQLNAFKCFFKLGKTREACPQTIRRPWQKNGSQSNDTTTSASVTLNP